MGPGLVSHWLWQSALRMRGLFNVPTRIVRVGGLIVSIRLADAWPFQPTTRSTLASLQICFNPPCGCVAFSTTHLLVPVVAAHDVSIRLADAWPFQRAPGGLAAFAPTCFNPPCGCVAFSTREKYGENPRMIGFNPPCGCVAFSTELWRHGDDAPGRVSIRLADAWPFQPPVVADHPGRLRFQSALRMRGLFNLAGRWLAVGWPGFNPPCGCVAFSTAARIPT